MTYPEGRTPITPDDMAKMHPSTWEAECRWQTIRAEQAIDEAKALRAENSRLNEERDRALAWRDKDWQASQDNAALQARVAKLGALVEKAYLEGWSHGAINYGAASVRMIEAQRAQDWRSISASRAALQEGKG